MFSRQQKQHRRVRLHAMLAVSALMEDCLMSVPIVMTDNMPLNICMQVATDPLEIEPIRRQALLIIRSISSFPNERYFDRLREQKVIPPLQSLGRSFAGEVGSAAGGEKKKERKVIQTGSGEASSDPTSLSLPSLGQIARDVLENMGAAIEEDEKAEKKEPEVTPWGGHIPDGQHWVPFKERNLTDFEREAIFYEKEVIKDGPLYVRGETIVYDFGRYVVLRIDHSPDPPLVPLYDLAHAKTDTMGLVIVDPLRFDQKEMEIKEEDIHLKNISQNDLSPASVEDGGLSHHEQGGKKKKKKKKHKHKHKHHHHHHHHQQQQEGLFGSNPFDQGGPEFVMIKEKPEALTRTLIETNPHFKLQQPLIDKIDQPDGIVLTSRKSHKETKLYQLKDDVLEGLVQQGTVSMVDVLQDVNPEDQITEKELADLSKEKLQKKKKKKKILPSEARRLKRLQEDKEKLVHCQLDGCQFRAKTFAHLSLHCALVHFKSEQPPDPAGSKGKHPDDGLLDLRAPPDSSRLRMLQRAQRTLQEMDSMTLTTTSAAAEGNEGTHNDAAGRQRKTLERKRRERRGGSSGGGSKGKELPSLDDGKARFRPILLDPVFPPVAPPGAPPTLQLTREPKWPLVHDFMEHRVELSGHEISIYTKTSRPNSKRDSKPWKGASQRK